MSTSQPPIIPGAANLTATWHEDAAQLEVVLANQVAVQLMSGNVLVTFGQALPPLVSGTPEQQQEQMSAAQAAGGVPIKALARFTIPTDIFQQMMQPLNQALSVITTSVVPQGTGAVVSDDPKESDADGADQ